MTKQQYFTIEFVCDSVADQQKLCQELQDKYPIYGSQDSGTRTTMWIDGKCPNEHTDREVLFNISNLTRSFGDCCCGATQEIRQCAEKAIGYN